MARFSTWSPYVFEYTPRHLIVTSDGRPVALVDKILRLSPGYSARPAKEGQALGAAIPETPVHPKFSIIDSTGNVIAIVEGVGKIFTGFSVRPVTVAEAALSDLNDGIF